MEEKKKRYTLEFKKEAVKYIQGHKKTIPEIAEELDVPAGTLRKWMNKYRQFPSEPFVGSGKMREDALEAKKLQQRIDDLEEENEILKKAMHFFSKDRK